MRWPWSKPEARQSATDAVLSALVSRAGGGVAGNPNASGALEMASGVWSRCFAAATVTPALSILTPTFMALVARNLARRGESVHLLDIADGRVVAMPVGSWDVRGDVDAATWIYQLHRFGPSRSRSQFVGSDGVLHFKYAVDPARPWQGISPLGWAADLGAIAGGTDLRLGEEAGGAVSRLIPIPIGIGGHLTMPPLPHHRAYGSVPRRFDRIRPQQGCRVWGGRASRNGGCVGPAGPPHVRPCASTPSASQRRWRLGPLRVPGGGAP